MAETNQPANHDLDAGAREVRSERRCASCDELCDAVQRHCQRCGAPLSAPDGVRQVVETDAQDLNGRSMPVDIATVVSPGTNVAGGEQHVNTPHIPFGDAGTEGRSTGVPDPARQTNVAGGNQYVNSPPVTNTLNISIGSLPGLSGAEVQEFARGFLRQDDDVPVLEAVTTVDTALQVDSELVDRIATRLEQLGILIVTCEDPDTLSALASQTAFHPRFHAHEKRLLPWDATGGVRDVVGRVTGPTVVVAHCVDAGRSALLRSLPAHEINWRSLAAPLHTANVRFLLLTTPEALGAVGLSSAVISTFVEADVDFVRPRLRALLGSRADGLEKEFRRQWANGNWGSTTSRCLELLTQAARLGSLAEAIEAGHSLERGVQAVRSQRPPDWSGVLAGDGRTPEERAVLELIFLVAAFFGERTGATSGLPVARFDATMRMLLPQAAHDLDSGGATSDSERLSRLEACWSRHGGDLTKQCGISLTRAPSGTVLATMTEPAWRSELEQFCLSADFSWRFARLATYVRRPSFVLGAPDLSTGALRVAMRSAESGDTHDDHLVLAWVCACAPSATTVDAAGLEAAMTELPPRDKGRLAAWLALLVSGLGVEQAASSLGRLVSWQQPELASAVLNRLWPYEGLRPTCLTLAHRLLNEAPTSVKDAVSRQLARELRRGVLTVADLYRRQELTGREPVSNRLPAVLLMHLLEETVLDGTAPGAQAGPLGDPAADSSVNIVEQILDPEVRQALECSPRLTRWMVLPGLWVIPTTRQWRAKSDILLPTVLRAWWNGVGKFVAAAIDEVVVADVARAVVLSAWAGRRTNGGLGETLVATLNSKALATVRRGLGAVDAGLGEVLETVLALDSLSVDERRSWLQHLRELKEQARWLRHSATRKSGTE